MVDFKTLKSRAEALTNRLSTLEGSTKVLKEQHDKAIEVLKSRYEISPEDLDEELIKTKAAVVRIEERLKEQLDQLESLG